MRHPRAIPLQHDLLQPASPPASPATSAGSGRGGPPRPPASPASMPFVTPVAAAEWWAAVQLPLDAGARDLEACARRALGFTPRVSLSPPDAVLLELRASLRLFGGAEALRAMLRASFPPPAVLAFAPTPLAATVFARCRRETCISDPSRLVGELAPLPLHALRWPEDVLRRLAAVGVRDIGGALRLPRAGFARRFGSGTLDALDRLLGRQRDPRHRYDAPERFRRRCDPDVELTDQAGVLGVLAPLCAELERFLRERQRGITSLLVLLGHRRQAPTRHVLNFAAPAQRAAPILKLLELQLGRAPLPAPVRRCELRSGPLVEGADDSHALWHPGEHGGGAAGAQMPAFLEQLRARLGARAVSGLALAEDHRPERLSLSSQPRLPTGGRARPGGAGATLPLPWSQGRRPLWLLETPAPLAVREGWPCRAGRRLHLQSGPERIETGWWDGHEVQRDYYQAVEASGARLWIFRERGPRGGGWFLHGFFG